MHTHTHTKTKRNATWQTNLIRGTGATLRSNNDRSVCFNVNIMLNNFVTESKNIVLSVLEATNTKTNSLCVRITCV